MIRTREYFPVSIFYTAQPFLQERPTSIPQAATSVSSRTRYRRNTGHSNLSNIPFLSQRALGKFTWIQFLHFLQPAQLRIRIICIVCRSTLPHSMQGSQKHSRLLNISPWSGQRLPTCCSISPDEHTVSWRRFLIGSSLLSGLSNSNESGSVRLVPRSINWTMLDYRFIHCLPWRLPLNML